MPLKTEHGASDSSLDEHSKAVYSSKVVVLADLNVDPPEMDDDSCVHVSASAISRLSVDESNHDKTVEICKDTNAMEVEGRRVSKIGKCRSRNNKVEYSLDSAADPDGDQHGQGVSTSREEKVSSLKTGLVHVARKMPKNAHAHFILGLMYQRLGQPQKALVAYEKAEEILLQSDVEIHRPEFLSLVQIHHAQCLLLESVGDNTSNEELEQEELDEVCSKLKHSMQSDVRQAAVWNTLGLLLLTTGRVKSAISVLSSLLAIVPNNCDCLGNLGIAYLQSGNMELSEKCFQELILTDQNHPAALINYAAFLLCKHGSTVVGAGANAGEGGVDEKVVGMNVAKECLLAALKVDPKAAHAWANLANAYFVTGDHRSSAKCLEKGAKLEPNCMSMRYAVAMHRLKDAERSQDRSEQLSWAGNEMASIIRDGDGLTIDHSVAWAGLSMVHKTQHEIAAGFRTDQSELREKEDHAVYSLNQEVRIPAAGSKGASKNQGELKDDTNISREEKQMLMRALSSPPFANYRVWWSLSDSKYAGTALFIKKCFQPKKVFFNLDRIASKHEVDGRVILAEFETFRLLNTYSPNNGWKEEEKSFKRRRKWDKRMLEFVIQSSDKPLIWCGDLNVSHEEIDVSHPDFFSAAKLNGYIPPNKEDCGQPGFTLAERNRFNAILKEGKLIDAYRYLHKEKDMERGFSWSGHPIGKYRGKRMRIDYFIVSESLVGRIVSCEMHGQGIELKGFYGSDHCPVSLELSEASSCPESQKN